MSYELAGKVEEWFFDAGASDLAFVKLIPNAEYTLRQGDKKIVVIRDEALQCAYCWEYDKYVSLKFTNDNKKNDKNTKEFIKMVTYLIGAKSISLSFEEKTSAKKIYKNFEVTIDKSTIIVAPVAAATASKTGKSLTFQFAAIGIKP